MVLQFAFLNETFATKSGSKEKVKKSKEGFTAPPQQTPVPNTAINAPNVPQIPPSSASPYAIPVHLEERPPNFALAPNYTGQQADQNYACRQFGICPPTTIEGFDSTVPTCQPLPPIRTPGIEHADDITKKMQHVNNLMEMTQADFQRLTLPQIPQPPSSSKIQSNLDGDMIDEEISSYLQETSASARSSAANPPYLSTRASTFDGAAPVNTYPPLYEPTKAPGASTASAPASTSHPPQTSSMACPTCPSPCPPPPTCPPRLDRMGQWMEIGMFVLAGILVLFLMEQIFRMGIMMGMKQTVQFLEPFVDYAQAVAPPTGRTPLSAMIE